MSVDFKNDLADNTDNIVSGNDNSVEDINIDGAKLNDIEGENTGSENSKNIDVQEIADVISASGDDFNISANPANNGEQESKYLAKIEELENNVIRTMADMQNLRKRTEKEVADANKYAVSKFALDMISVLENLQRAQHSVDQKNIADNDALKSLLEGVNLTANDLTTIFKKHGIEAIDAIGVKFDHNIHQAIVQIPDNNYEAGTVIELMQAGYMIKNRLLRPAMVGVAKAAPIIDAAIDTDNTAAPSA